MSYSDESSLDSLLDEVCSPFSFNKKPFTYPHKSLHIEADFIGGQSWPEIDIPVQDVTLCVGKPSILGLCLCVQPGDFTILYLWRSCNGGKKCAQYLHCLHHFLMSYPIGAGHLTISHDRGGHLYNEMACRYYQLITSPSSPKGQRLFYDIQVIPYTTGHSGNDPDRKSAHFEASFKRRLRRYFTLPERVRVIEQDHPDVHVHIVEKFYDIPLVLKNCGIYLNVKAQPDLTLIGQKGLGFRSLKPLSMEFGWSKCFNAELSIYGYKHHPDQVWLRQSVNDQAPRRRLWMVKRKYRGTILPNLFMEFPKQYTVERGMRWSMLVAMRKFANDFAKHDKEVHDYWALDPAIIVGKPSDFQATLSTQQNAISDDSSLDTEIKFSNYIEACMVGNNLAKFLDGFSTSSTEHITSVQNNELNYATLDDEKEDIDAGEESEGIGSDTGHIDEDCCLNLTGPEPEEQTWLQSKNLRDYRMKQSHFMSTGRSCIGRNIVHCRGNVDLNVTVKAFRTSVDGYSSRVQLAKQHGITYRGARRGVIRNILDHLCEYHGWGDEELKQVDDLFDLHIN